MESRIAKKYATALFALARAQGVEQAVWSDLAALRAGLEGDLRLSAILLAPQIPDDDKRRLMETVLHDAHPIVRHFVLFAIDKRRTEHLLPIIAMYHDLLDAAMGIVEAKITSAVPLDENETRQIVARLEKISGKTVRHEATVDPEILGGVIVMMGGEILDHSVRHDLTRLRDALHALKVHEAA